MSDYAKPQTLRDPILYLIDRFMKRQTVFADDINDIGQDTEVDEPVDLIYDTDKNLIQVKTITVEINLNYLPNGDLDNAEILDYGKDKKTTFFMTYDNEGDLIHVEPIIESLSQPIIME